MAQQFLCQLSHLSLFGGKNRREIKEKTINLVYVSVFTGKIYPITIRLIDQDDKSLRRRLLKNIQISTSVNLLRSTAFPARLCRPISLNSFHYCRNVFAVTLNSLQQKLYSSRHSSIVNRQTLFGTKIWSLNFLSLCGTIKKLEK